MALSINDLPREVLALILENLTKPNDRRRAAQVCKLFYEIVRHQSTLMHNNVLKLQESATKTSPIRVIQNSEIFPFSKLHIGTGHWLQNVIMESAFWSLHGEKINEIIFNDGNVRIGDVLPILNAYFPNLKKMTIKGGFSDSSDADSNSYTISLPIEDLSLNNRDMSLDQILTLLRCSQLKNLEIKSIKAYYLPQILPWLETIESSRLSFDEIALEELINLPSKVVIDEIRIKFNETPKTIREFFEKPRTIDTLYIKSKFGNEEFDEDESDEDGYNWPIRAVVYFTLDQLIALGGAKSIKNVQLLRGVPEFEGSLDRLAELPGLETILLDLNEDLPNPLYPFYWSLAETAQKIREVDVYDVSYLHYLAGLSSMTTITIFIYDETEPRGPSIDEIQIMIRNCPNLKKLVLSGIEATDADLIGHGDLLPISSLEKLEFLDIGSAPNITLEAFKSAFMFPNLKYFDVDDYNLSDEEPFNQDVAKLFTQNCPNLEHLEVNNCPITWEGFDYLIRHLPYLRNIKIRPKGKRHSLSKDKVEELQQEFPYITIKIRKAMNDYSFDDSF